MTTKFAIVREDPAPELELVGRVHAKSALVVASGGDNAFALRHRFPDLHVTAFDINPHQLAHVRRKQEAIACHDLPELSIEDARSTRLNQSGEFEGLFRTLKQFLLEFVLTSSELDEFFAPSTKSSTREMLVSRWKMARYWGTAFAVTFGDPFLLTMFGPRALQHAEPGSYPRYFQRVFEQGLHRANAANNPFLQHVLLGAYRTTDAPAHLLAKKHLDLELIEGDLSSVPQLDRFQVYSLSNVLDWSSHDETQEWAQTLISHALPGSAVILRQLNNQRDVRAFFEPAFQFDHALGARLQQADQSLFYERIEIGFRR